jgi:2-polyprenyl-3-methyl-5-hydroxy-6-metoxy-1,4-benzoquinol methylase
MSLRALPGIESVAFHADLAPGWEQRYTKKSFRARIAALAECLIGELFGGSIWLDAGCGTGTLSRWLAERGCAVLGVDAASSMIAAAEALSENAAVECRPEFARIESIERLRLDRGSFDGILCSSVLEYVDDPVGCLAEFVRVLKPGGLLLVSIPNRVSIVRKAQVAGYRFGAGLGQNWFPFIQHSRHQYRAHEFSKVLSQAGFATETIIPFGSPLPTFVQRMNCGGSLLMFKARKIE